MFDTFLVLFFASADHFVRQDSGRIRQEVIKILAETAKILINLFTLVSRKLNTNEQDLFAKRTINQATSFTTELTKSPSMGFLGSLYYIAVLLIAH